MINDLTKDDPRTYAIIGAAMEVHRVLWFFGAGLSESPCCGIRQTKNPYLRETSFPVFYKDVELNVPYRPDFICFDDVVVELKALARIGGTEESQVINYLKVTGHETGLLLNFGTRSLEYRRFVLSKS